MSLPSIYAIIIHDNFLISVSIVLLWILNNYNLRYSFYVSMPFAFNLSKRHLRVKLFVRNNCVKLLPYDV